MIASARPLLQVFNDPAAWQACGPVQLDQLLRQAGRGNLTASLGHRLAGAGLRAGLAPRIRDRFRAAEVVAAEHERRLRFGLRLASRVFAGSDIPVIVLKGGAYLLGGFPTAPGRLTSDLDLMVPEARLAEAEALFHAADWRSEAGDDYDEHYYRAWMHELPPLQHPHLGITVDLHHNISPRTGRLRIDAARLFAAAVPLAGDSPFLRLADEDLVLHLCVHLFHDGEFHAGLRELLDLDGALRRCAATEGFWPRLQARAAELGLRRPLYYGLHFSTALLHTPVPAAVQRDLARAAPPPPLRWLMQAAMAQVLPPPAGDRPPVARRLAATLLLLRAHWLRMPLPLLLRHLYTQVRRRGGFKTKEAAAR